MARGSFPILVSTGLGADAAELEWRRICQLGHPSIACVYHSRRHRCRHARKRMKT